MSASNRQSAELSPSVWQISSASSRVDIGRPAFANSACRKLAKLVPIEKDDPSSARGAAFQFALIAERVQHTVNRLDIDARFNAGQIQDHGERCDGPSRLLAHSAERQWSVTRERGDGLRRAQMSLGRLFVCCSILFFLAPEKGYASFNGQVSCPGSGQLFAYPSTPSPLGAVTSTFFLALYPYDTDTNAVVPVTLSWTSTTGTPKSVAIQNPEAVSINLQAGTAVTYSCATQGTATFAAGREGVYFPEWSPLNFGGSAPGTGTGDANIDIDCYHFGGTGTLFKELAGITSDIFVYLVNIDGGVGTNQTITLVYTNSTGPTSYAVSANSTVAFPLHLEANSTFTYSCPSGVYPTGYFGFESTGILK
jgi:hypothetical protein